jgi:hypothetical protein
MTAGFRSSTFAVALRHTEQRRHVVVGRSLQAWLSRSLFRRRSPAFARDDRGPQLRIAAEPWFGRDEDLI